MADPQPSSPASRALLLSAALLWSLGGILAKNEWIEQIPVSSRGPVLACYRALFAAVCLVPLVRWRRVHWRMALLPMALSYSAMNVLYVSALTRTTAAAAIFLQYTATAWAALLGWLLLGERIRRGDLVALGLAAAGISCIVAAEWSGANALGNLLGVASGIGYASVIVGLRSLRDEDPFWLVFLNNLTGGLALLPWVLGMQVPLDAPQWSVIASFGVIQLAIPYLLFARALRGVSAHEAALLTIIEAVLNPLWVWLFIGEIAPASNWVGGALIMTGLVLRYTLFAPALTMDEIVLEQAAPPIPVAATRADDPEDATSASPL
jgi:drug/metabolite transporter (DMT)-like permease